MHHEVKVEWGKTAYRVHYQDQVSSLLPIPEELKHHQRTGKLHQNPLSLLLLKISGRDYEDAPRFCVLY